ncbi:hypothetical protein U27_01605 [Candidatus Vecturithrix granuli]|uniref:Uncharacterized protein n=1 Tax=Vecturithrix granuli TaxID=1499967 RepID=A0A0S6W5A1_VECG1|nr:hypothetical protein U27_01605 [Candidatus Vecturithrix granuli]
MPETQKSSEIPTLDPAKLDILKLAYEMQEKSVMYHNELAFKIFSWSTTLLFALITLLTTLSKNLTDIHQWTLTIAVVVLTSFLYNWQRHNRLEKREHIANLSFMDQLFHFRDHGYYGGDRSIYEDIWHAEEPVGQARLGFHAFNITMVLLAVLTLVMIWTV